MSIAVAEAKSGNKFKTCVIYHTSTLVSFPKSSYIFCDQILENLHASEIIRISDFEPLCLLVTSPPNLFLKLCIIAMIIEGRFTAIFMIQLYVN